MKELTLNCSWCGNNFYRNELAESRFLGGLVCQKCDADEPSRTLSEIHEKLKERSINYSEKRYEKERERDKAHS